MRAYSLIPPPLLQPIPNFAKTLTSHDAHSTVIILLLPPKANVSTYTTVGSRIFLQQATNRFYNIRISPAFEGGLEGVAPGKLEYFASENWFMEKAPDWFGFSKGKNLDWVRRTGIFCCALEIDDRGNFPVIAGAVIIGQPRLELWHSH